MGYRVPLLQQGVELFEIRALLGNTAGSGETRTIAAAGNYGLHAKLFVFDRRRVFFGSMNFDQRSLHLNTELGLLIDSPELAEQIARRFAAMVQPGNAYALALRPAAGHGAATLEWHTAVDGKALVFDVEPARSAWQRRLVKLLSMLPLDDEL
jgi:putative cardiolipin synthase